ncbi:MAG: enoyl-CoA hydratase/isomerase family protein [Candidatus Freyarchaeum deiterrae]
MKKVVLWEKEDGIATITLNRPESLNAINRELTDQFYDTLTEIDRDWDVHVVILKGAGRAFCTGADLKMISNILEKGADYIYETMFKVQQVNFLLKTLRPPVIAAMHKYALGGGYEFAASCDFRFCTEDTIMGPIEIEVGLLPFLEMCIFLYGVSIRSVGRLSPTRSGDIRLVTSVQVFLLQRRPRGVRTHGKRVAAQTQTAPEYRQTGEPVPVVVHATGFFASAYHPRWVLQVFTADGTSGGSPPWVHVKNPM